MDSVELLGELREQADIPEIFSKIDFNLKNDDAKLRARCASCWEKFSNDMPTFLAKAASRLDDHRAKAAIVTTAWEELGEGDDRQNHAILFERAVNKSNIDPAVLDKERKQVSPPLPSGLALSSDRQIFGICVGLEIPANENISTLFNALCGVDGDHETIRNTQFFKIHFVNEDRHIAEGIGNAIRIYNVSTDDFEFMSGFRQASRFWRDYWRYVEGEP